MAKLVHDNSPVCARQLQPIFALADGLFLPYVQQQVSGTVKLCFWHKRVMR